MSRRLSGWSRAAVLLIGLGAGVTASPGFLAAQQAPFCQGPASRDPSWAPDGERILYSSNRTGNYEIWSMRTDGSDQRRLTDTRSSLHYPFASPDGTRIAFSVIDSTGMRVGLADASGGEVRYLTDIGDEAADPIWTPDGRLVYSSARGGQRDLWVTDLTGIGAPLFHLEGDEWAPRVAPSGDRIAFATNRDGDGDIYTAAFDGSEVRNLTESAGWEGVPSWSIRDEIAFYGRTLPDTSVSASVRASWATAELRAVAAEGGRVRQLTRNHHRDQSPSWSPDGERLAFASCASGTLEVWVADADGGDPRRLTRTVSRADSLAIEEALRGYVEGWRDADIERLATVFAPDGVILWTSGDTVNSVTFRETLENRRPNPGFGDPWRLSSLRIVDEHVAVAEVFIVHSDGVEYTDLLTLYRLGNSWKIVAKAFSLRRD